MRASVEVVFVPVTDADRERDFWADAFGAHVDVDRRVGEGLRFVQVTPQGSSCSFAFGEGLGVDLAPGSLAGVMLVIDDADAAYAELTAKGVQAEPVDEQPWGRFVAFRDPEGNRFTLQQLVRQSG